MSIPWSGVGTAGRAPVDVCVAEVEGDAEAWEVTCARSAVTEAWLSLPEVTCFLGAAFQPDDNFQAKSCFICARAFVVGTFFLVLDKHVM